MTLNTTIPNPPPAATYIQQYGCQVTVFPANQINRVEVWRAPDNGSGVANDAAAVQANVLQPGPVGGIVFIDPLPNDGAKRYYKSRHIDIAGNVSVFTAYSDGLVPELITGAAGSNPMAAFGAIVDKLPPSAKYEIRLASNYVDPDLQDGMQSYIDFVATTNFMRVGQTPIVVSSSTAANPTVVTTAAAHGYVTGDQVTIRGHLTNTAVNGSNPIIVLTATTFSIPVDTHLAAAGSGGHVVKLSLTIDGFGNLIVYAIVRAVSLIVSGAATFNGIISSLAGALFRTLQHSTTGNYSDTNMKRVMLRNDNVEAYGDVPATVDGDGDGTKLAALIGSHTVNPSTITSQSSASQSGGAAGWTDPDGSSNGLNTLSRTSTGGSTVVDTSRLWCRVSTVLNSDTNPDAYDDLYTLTFKVQATASATSGEVGSTASVDIEYSTDGGTNWTTASGGPYTANADSLIGPASQTVTYNPVVTVAGALTQLRFRLKLSLTTSVQPGTTSPSSTATVSVFSATWLTDTYPVTWSTSSGSSYGRRGLRLPKTKQGQSLKNPGLELSITVWETGASVAIITDATKAHGGSKYLQITSAGGGGTVGQTDGGAALHYFPVSPNDVVTFGGWLYRETGTSSLRFAIKTYDASKVLVATQNGVSMSVTGSWHQNSDTYTIPASGVAYITFYAEITAVDATIGRFDDMSLVIGTDDLPPVYLEPLDTATSDAKAVEGEIEFVGGTDGPHALHYHDGEKMRPIARTLLADHAATSAATSDFLIATCPIKARRMNKAGRVLRVRWSGRAASGGSVVTLKLAGVAWVTLTVTASLTWHMDYTFTTGTTGASGTLDGGGIKTNGGTVTSDDGTTAAFDLTADFNVDFFVHSTSGTLTSRIATVTWEATQ